MQGLNSGVEKAEEFEKDIENSSENGIIKDKEMFRSKPPARNEIKPISEKRFNELTIEARKIMQLF